MVCVPCFIIPLLLFLWRFIQPFVLRFWNPFEKKEDGKGPSDITECSLFSSCPCIKKKDVDGDKADDLVTGTNEINNMKVEPNISKTKSD